MRHIDEIQIAGTAILLCGAMFAVSAVAPTGNTVSKAVTNFTEAPETAAEAQAQAEAQAEEDGFTIYTQESNYDSDYDNSYNDTSYNDSSYNTDTTQDGSLDDTGQENDNTDTEDQSDAGLHAKAFFKPAPRQTGLFVLFYEITIIMFLFLNKWYNQTVINIQEAFYEETKQVTITNSISVPSAVYLSSAISTDGKS